MYFPRMSKNTEREVSGEGGGAPEASTRPNSSTAASTLSPIACGREETGEGMAGRRGVLFFQKDREREGGEGTGGSGWCEGLHARGWKAGDWNLRKKKDRKEPIKIKTLLEYEGRWFL